MHGSDSRVNLTQLMPPTPQSCATYMFYDGNDVVYVGMTCNPLARWGSHVRDSKWVRPHMTVSWRWWKSERRAESVEAYLIRALSPIHNKALRPHIDVDQRTMVDKRQLVHNLKRDVGLPYEYSYRRLPPIIVRMMDMAIESDYDVAFAMARRNDEMKLVQQLQAIFDK